jgi:hypothetical protein
MPRYDIPELVRTIVEEALGVDPLGYLEGSALGADLGLDSLDLLDIFFRVECCVPVLLSVERAGAYLQGDVPDAEFCDEHGVVSARGLRQLKTVMPQFDPDAWQSRLRTDQLLPLMTTGNLISMVEELLSRRGQCSHA